MCDNALRKGLQLVKAFVYLGLGQASPPKISDFNLSLWPPHAVLMVKTAGCGLRRVEGGGDKILLITS